MANEALEHKEPEAVVQELLDLTDADQARMWRALRWYAHRLDVESEDLYQEAILRILGGSRNCPKDTDSLSFFIGVVRSITSEIYEKNKKVTDQQKYIPLDDTFWGNQQPKTPDKMLMMRRGESENLPDGLLEAMREEAEQDSDSEVEQYLIHSLVHGANHAEIVSMSNWSEAEAHAIQRRASRLKNRHVELFKANGRKS